jgi:hypothetical protein
MTIHGGVSGPALRGRAFVGVECDSTHSTNSRLTHRNDIGWRAIAREQSGPAG